MARRRFLLQSVTSVGPGGKPKRGKNLDRVSIIRSLLKTMKDTELCSLSTVSPGSNAHGAHVYFAFTPKLELFFLSDPNSTHCKNLRSNSSMAVSIYDSSQKWGARTGDRGIALYGSCKETSGVETLSAERIYGNRFKRYAAWRASPDYLGEAYEWRFYKFVAHRVKVFDERRFGSGVFVTAVIRR